MNLTIICYFLIQVLPLAATCSTRHGFWGPHCNKPCEIHCGYDCNSRNGRCYGCISGFWGDYCNLPCPNNCQQYCYQYYGSFISPHVLSQVISGIDACGSSCNQNTGECYRCEDQHFWGALCNESCSLNNTGCELCDITSQKLRCKKCKSGFEDTCKLDDTTVCPENCISCNSKTKNCNFNCVQGFWGQNCTNTCMNKNCDHTGCNKNNGDCDWCLSGWWGSDCTKHSDLQQCAHCNRQSGVCDLCMDGFWGSSCENTCSDGCVESRCEMHTAKCAQCKGLFWGDACNMSCLLDDCESMFGCTREFGPSCFKCKLGKWGDRCSKPCPKNCAYGCKIDTGECLNKEQTADATGQKKIQEAAETDIKSVIGISVGCAVAVNILLLLLSLLVFRIYKLRIQTNTGSTANTQSKSHSNEHNLSEGIEDDEISRLRRELEKITREEQRLKRKKTDELRRKLNEKKEIISKLRGEKDGVEECYEIPVFHGTDSSEYESLRD